MIIGTIATTNHLPRAMVMAKSVKEHMPDARVILCLLERERHSSLKAVAYFDSVVLAKELGFEHFDRYIFKYNRFQASCSLKAKLMQYLLQAYTNEVKFIYLDSDTRLYSPLRELNDILDTSSIVVTPHCLYPYIKDAVKRTFHNEHHTTGWRELGILKTGLYNAGFFALKRTKNAEKFLEWWNYRLERYCYRDIKEGLFDDQRWLDLAPIFFEAHVLIHPGYNVAFWNISERIFGIEESGRYTINGDSLRFIHFSGVGGFLDEMISRNFPNPGDAQGIQSLLSGYCLELDQFQQSSYLRIPWSYGRFMSGEEVSDDSRRKYRSHAKLYDSQYDNPFSLKNKKFSREKIRQLEASAKGK